MVLFLQTVKLLFRQNHKIAFLPKLRHRIFHRSQKLCFPTEITKPSFFHQNRWNKLPYQDYKPEFSCRKDNCFFSSNQKIEFSHQNCKNHVYYKNRKTYFFHNRKHVCCKSAIVFSSKIQS